MEKESKETRSLKGGWKLIWKKMMEHKKEIVLLSGLGVISAVANGSVPYIMGLFFDALITPKEAVFVGLSLWVVILGIWTITQLVANSVDWIIDRRARYLGIYVHLNMQESAFSHLLKLPLSYHKTHKVGEIAEKINKSGWMTASIIESVVIGTAPQILSIIVGTIIAFTINPVLAMILLIGISAYVITLFKIVPPIAKAQDTALHEWGKSHGDAYDAYANVAEVKHATAEFHEEDKNKFNYYKKVLIPWYKVEAIWNNINSFQRFIVLVTQITIFVLSVKFITEGVLSIGGLIALNGYAALVFGPFVMIGRNWQTIENGIVALKQADELIFSQPTENYKPDGGVAIDNLAGQVEFSDVSFQYDKESPIVLNGINLKVEQGETVALVGRSGVGKSTLIDLISGYHLPTKGKVLVDGYEITMMNLTGLRKHIAVVPQEVVLFNGTVEDNIKYGTFEATHEEVAAAAHEANADIFIDTFPDKYKQIVGERGIKLSVGQKQRIAIARAILRNPSILILDEPTSALDIETEHCITQALGRLMEGRTTFIIAHRLSTVRNADRIVVFEKGEIIEKGNHKELVAKKDGVYKKLYDLHIGLQ